MSEITICKPKLWHVVPFTSSSITWSALCDNNHTGRKARAGHRFVTARRLIKTKNRLHWLQQGLELWRKWKLLNRCIVGVFTNLEEFQLVPLLLSHFYRKCNVKIKRKIFLIIFKAVGEMFGTDVHWGSRPSDEQKVLKGYMKQGLMGNMIKRTQKKCNFFLSSTVWLKTAAQTSCTL